MVFTRRFAADRINGAMESTFVNGSRVIGVLPRFPVIYLDLCCLRTVDSWEGLAKSLANPKGRTFAFGGKGSTSGYLIPLHHLMTWIHDSGENTDAHGPLRPLGNRLVIELHCRDGAGRYGLGRSLSRR